jgi:Domain of unknown function (DUF5666)
MKKIMCLMAALAIVSAGVPSMTLAQTATTTPAINGVTTSYPKTLVKKIKKQTFTGKITAINGNSLAVTLTKGQADTVDVSSAKMVRHYGAAMTVADLQVNDSVTIQGTLSGSTITASMLRDDSLQLHSGNFSGTITAISGASFILKTPKRSYQTINTNSATIIKEGGKAAQFSALTVSSTVAVSGVWDRTNSNVYAKTVSIVTAAPTPAQIACIGSAVNARETALDSAMSAYTQAINTAYTGRASALQAAYGLTSGNGAIKNAVSAAWKSFASAIKSAHANWQTSKKSDWSTFSTAVKACKAPVVTTDSGESSSEASGN